MQPGHLPVEGVDRLAHPEPEVGGDLVVARTGGVQASRRGADEIGEPALDVHVNVLESAREREFARLDFALDLVQSSGDGVGVGALDDALFGEHGDVGLRPRDVLRREFAVEIDGGVDFLHDFGGAGYEASAPHLVAHVSQTLERNEREEFDAAPNSAGSRTSRARGRRRAILEAERPGKVEAECSAASKATAAKLAPLAKGEIAALAVDAKPRPALDLAFNAPDGKKVTLADFKGRALLLNLWATWCVPCRAEMPALDRLQAKDGGADFEVVAINVDTARLERAPAFLYQIGVKSLTRYADPAPTRSRRCASPARRSACRRPLDRQGRLRVGVVAGPANWDRRTRSRRSAR